jgi:hypothetical protein
MLWLVIGQPEHIVLDKLVLFHLERSVLIQYRSVRGGKLRPRLLRQLWELLPRVLRFVVK